VIFFHAYVAIMTLVSLIPVDACVARVRHYQRCSPSPDRRRVFINVLYLHATHYAHAKAP
jgi:hypothetical protein